MFTKIDGKQLQMHSYNWDVLCTYGGWLIRTNFGPLNSQIPAWTRLCQLYTETHFSEVWDNTNDFRSSK